MFKITVVKLTDNSPTDQPAASAIVAISFTELYSQTFDEINLPALIKALNPSTRKRRKNAKETAPA